MFWRGAALEQHRVDEDVERVGGQREHRRERVDPDASSTTVETHAEHDAEDQRGRAARRCGAAAPGGGCGASARRCRGRRRS